MNLILIVIVLFIFAERIFKHWLVVRFFRLSVPAQTNSVQLVSILQPILSGDPTLAAGLEQNLNMNTRYALEFLWLVDDDDLEGQRICRSLMERYSQKHIRLLLLPPPESRQNPKMVKLIAGTTQAQGDVLCVLDDDTRLPDFGLEECLPHLDQPGVGLAFGLPYYVSFYNIWSQLVAYFVNSHSLLTYIPYATLTAPVTINGMFYAMRRSVFDIIGGFEGLEHFLADDFAIAQRMRAHGYRLAQTSLRHGISTSVADFRHYFSLIQRWFIFPRESIMRHVKGREQIFFYVMVVVPVFFPWLALLVPLISPSFWPLTVLYFFYSYLIFAHINLAYLRQASPWTHSYWAILLPIFLPLQILAAMFAPQRIVWRGHLMQAETGGRFKFVRRRSSDRP